jgi:sigma-B regulation protein RsbQ
MKENDKVKQWGNEGEVLVFLHYFGGSAQSWKWVAEKLSDDYRCIAINLPGFGGAPAMEKLSIQDFAAYVQEELKSLEIKSYTLIGHSMGGKIAMQIAANASRGSVQQLILVAPSPPTTEPMPQDEKERMLHHPDRQEAEKTVKGAVKQTLTEDQYRLAVNTQLVIDQATWRWWLLEGMDNSIAERIKPLELPITVLASKDDPVMTSDVIEQRVMQVLDGAKLVTTQKVGHLSPLEVPDWIAAQIRNTLEAGKTA